MLAVLSTAAGLAPAAVLSHYLDKLLYGVTASDTTTFAIMPLVMIAIAIAASLRPALRAASIDPIRVLREE